MLFYIFVIDIIFPFIHVHVYFFMVSSFDAKEKYNIQKRQKKKHIIDAKKNKYEI